MWPSLPAGEYIATTSLSKETGKRIWRMVKVAFVHGCVHGKQSGRFRKIGRCNIDNQGVEGCHVIGR